jgi:2-polyprenyl-6-methoxyphenol hydroxylase-like FAD-dependent oxidoreductase
VLVVGAGSTGLTCVISLINQGVTGITIADAVPQGENTSQALVIHTATLEVCHSNMNYIRAFILFRPLKLNVQSLSLTLVSKERRLEFASVNGNPRPLH